MLKKLRAAWEAGVAGQPMPATVDRSVGQTGAIVGIFGVAVIALFGTAYAIGTVEKNRRKKESERKDIEDDELDELEADAEAAKLELVSNEDLLDAVTEEEGEEEEDDEEDYHAPPGSAACPQCHSVHLDSDDAAECCPDEREWGDDEEEIDAELSESVPRSGATIVEDNDPHFRQNFETGDISDPSEDDPEPEGVEDLLEDFGHSE